MFPTFPSMRGEWGNFTILRVRQFRTCIAPYAYSHSWVQMTRSLSSADTSQGYEQTVRPGATNQSFKMDTALPTQLMSTNRCDRRRRLTSLRQPIVYEGACAYTIHECTGTRTAHKCKCACKCPTR
jgi:hypothetical protein